jgi:hypothetical protein
LSASCAFTVSFSNRIMMNYSENCCAADNQARFLT